MKRKAIFAFDIKLYPSLFTFKISHS
jgi:hypothetical protein